MSEPVTVSTILEHTFSLVRGNPREAALALAVMVVPAVAIDVLAPPETGYFLFYLPGLIGIFVQFVLTGALLRKTGMRRSDAAPARAGAFVGAQILTSLGIVLGFVLLVVPGLYLWARWSLVAPLIVGEQLGLGDALRESAERSRPHIGAIMAALALLAVATLVAIGIVAFVYPEDGPATLGVAIAANLLTYVPQILSWHAFVAIHALLRGPQQDLEEIFA